MRIAVIGAGLSGLAAAGALARGGHEVSVFEKSRGVGGRLATRRLDGGLVANHGAPALDASQGSALDDAARSTATGAVDVLGAPPANAPLGRPILPEGGVTAVAKALAAPLDVVRSVRIARMRPVVGGYELGDEQGNGHGRFDGVVISAPGPQAADLLATVPGEDDRAERVRSVAYDPAVMLIGIAAHGERTARIVHAEGAIGRVATVPHPHGPTVAVVAQLATDLAARLLDDAADAEVIAAAGDPWSRLPVPGEVAWDMVKRWRFATVRPETVDPNVAAAGTGVVLCGDAVAGPGMEGIWASGERAAELVVAECS